MKNFIAKCYDFLFEYSDDIICEHLKQFLKYLSELNQYIDESEIISKDKHYKKCSWSIDGTTSGPETCICCYAARCIYKINHLMNLYRRLKKKN